MNPENWSESQTGHYNSVTQESMDPNQNPFEMIMKANSERQRRKAMTRQDAIPTSKEHGESAMLTTQPDGMSQEHSQAKS